MPSSSRTNLADILSLDPHVDKGCFNTFTNFMKNRLGMEHVVYFSPSFKGHSFINPHIEMTYSLDWAERYKEKNYAAIDPLFSNATKESLFIDWRDISRKEKVVRDFFGEASDFGCGNQGLSIPIRFPNSSNCAIFTLTNIMFDSEWHKFRKHVLKEAILFAHYYHARTMELKGELTNGIKALSRREREVALWASEGKTLEDISVILNLSKETIKAYLDSIRKKTNALNTTHAVTILYRNGML